MLVLFWCTPKLVVVLKKNIYYIYILIHEKALTPLFMFIHLPLIHFGPPPRFLIDFKNSKWLTYFCTLLCICYCFSHLIGLHSVTWLSLFYKFTRFFIYFMFLSDEGPMLEMLDYSIRIGSTPSLNLYLHCICFQSMRLPISICPVNSTPFKTLSCSYR